MTNAIRVFDRYGAEQNWAWLVEHYGEIVIHPANPGPGWRVIEIWENADAVLVGGDTAHTGAFMGIEAAAIILVQVRGVDGLPEEDIPVAWYWPDAPYDPEAGPANGLPEGMIAERADGPGYTNAEGNTAFAMGPGAYYDPATGGGPHAVWVYGQGTNSDVIWKLGMIAGTPHDGLWPVFQWDPDTPIQPPPPPSPPEPPDDELRQAALKALELAQEIRRQALDIETVLGEALGVMGTVIYHDDQVITYTRT